MANQANITSLDALESFRASLIVFMAKARTSLDDAGDEVRRTRVWLQNDQRLHWEGEARRRAKALDQAQQELLSARLSTFRDATVVAQAAVFRAKRALAEAEEKLKKVKAWNHVYDGNAQPIAKRLDSLRQFLDQEMPKAVAYLLNTQKTLEAYAETRSPAESEPLP